MNLSNLANLINCITNDMKYIHLHSVGKNFDTIHSISNEYYDKLSSDYDSVAELAIAYNEDIKNSNTINTTEWDSAIGYYDIDAGIELIYTKITILISALKTIKESNEYSEVSNTIDDLLNFWFKENNYKNKSRLG